MKILVINGPNINFLGIREKGIYGNDNYDTLVDMINKKAEELNVKVEVFQSNHEGAIIDKLQEAYYNHVDGIVINPGAFKRCTCFDSCNTEDRSTYIQCSYKRRIQTYICYSSSMSGTGCRTWT